MLILSLESSAKAASVALVRDGRQIAMYSQNSGLTHSRTLLPMVEDLLRNTETQLKDIDRVAVSHGPGSFTGVRIGISVVKGLSWASGIPACGVSTLEAAAYAGIFASEGAVICASMDARRDQVYNALFLFRHGRPERLCDDRAISLADLKADILELGRDNYRDQYIFLVGDGAELCYTAFSGTEINAILAPEPVRMQNAWGVAMAAEGLPAGDSGDLIPVYLRLSQAERERQERLSSNSF